MANVMKCDHCGNIYNYNEWVDIGNTKVNGFELTISTLATCKSTRYIVDLCPDCMKEVLKEYFGYVEPEPEPDPENPDETDTDIPKEVEE